MQNLALAEMHTCNKMGRLILDLFCYVYIRMPFSLSL